MEPSHQPEWDKEHCWQIEIERTLLENLWFDEMGVAVFAGRIKLDGVLYRFWKDGKPNSCLEVTRRMLDLADTE